jgi:hypothetical protein
LAHLHARSAAANYYVPAGIIALAAVLLVETQLLPLAQSLSGGGALTVERFIAPGPGGAFGHYLAGDPILFSLLTWAGTHLAHDFTDPAYRFWSAVPALAAAALMTASRGAGSGAGRPPRSPSWPPPLRSTWA